MMQRWHQQTWLKSHSILAEGCIHVGIMAGSIRGALMPSSPCWMASENGMSLAALGLDLMVAIMSSKGPRNAEPLCKALAGLDTKGIGEPLDVWCFK